MGYYKNKLIASQDQPVESLPGYDAWKLATPPEYEYDYTLHRCPECQCYIDDHSLTQDVEDLEQRRAEERGEDPITCGDCADCRYDISRYDFDAQQQQEADDHADFLIQQRKEEGF